MAIKDKQLANSTILILVALFIASLIVSNLIFQKFIYWEPFGVYRFKVSIGILPWNIFTSLLISSFLVKIIIAALNTPILYGIVFLFRKRFNLKINEEILE